MVSEYRDPARYQRVYSHFDESYTDDETVRGGARHQRGLYDTYIERHVFHLFDYVSLFVSFIVIVVGEVVDLVVSRNERLVVGEHGRRSQDRIGGLPFLLFRLRVIMSSCGNI